MYFYKSYDCPRPPIKYAIVLLNDIVIILGTFVFSLCVHALGS